MSESLLRNTNLARWRRRAVGALSIGGRFQIDFALKDESAG